MISGAGGAEESKCNDPELLKLEPVHHADWFESRNLPGWDSYVYMSEKCVTTALKLPPEMLLNFGAWNLA